MFSVAGTSCRFFSVDVCTSGDLSLTATVVKRSSRLVFVRHADGQHVLSMYLFFYIVDGWSDVKLEGLSGWSWAALGASGGDLGLLLAPL